MPFRINLILNTVINISWGIKYPNPGAYDRYNKPEEREFFFFKIADTTFLANIFQPWVSTSFFGTSKEAAGIIGV